MELVKNDEVLSLALWISFADVVVPHRLVIFSFISQYVQLAQTEASTDCIEGNQRVNTSISLC
ncbi:unnamed protein product [Strongylus vulgaris]|uniref:Uncharacterized protein n=1 Tax=Strongylus vulgaris TaxID=40348 RepID=A0A3P7KSY6_STRVU|nr:unnamed protein product [Strongylus vulgaris]